MTFHAIPRNPAGKISLPGRVRTLETDFLSLNALPSWLTATIGGGNVSVSGGELLIASGPNGASPAYVSGPSIDLTAVESVAFTVYNQSLPVGPNAGQNFQALATVPAIMSLGDIGRGAMLHTAPDSTGTYLRSTVGDWPVANSFKVDDGFLRAASRTTRTIVILPKTGMVYAIEDGTEVMHARDLSAVMVLGSIAPILMARGVDAAKTRTVATTGVKIEIGYP